MSNARAVVLNIFHAALAAVHGASCVQRFLTARPLQGEVRVVAIGKAAAAMLEGARLVLGGGLHSALLVTKPGYGPSGALNLNGVTMMESGHPLPDQRSLQAGQQLLDFIAAAPGDATLLFLISGGTSSLVEVPAPGVTLEALRDVNRWLLGSGWDIGRMNALRKRLSLIKGGRLAGYLQGRRVMQLLISDVPGDNLADIGSGLLVADDGIPIDEASLPAWLRNLLQDTMTVPRPPASAFVDIETHIIASLDQALAAAADEARGRAYAVQLHAERLSGDAEQNGRCLAQQMLDGAPGVHLWGGETTVRLPPHPGRGGRNQHLALAAAEVMAKRDNVWLLAAGSDGGDGPGEDAGAVVDGGTVARGELDGLGVMDCLRRADAGSFLEASGDLITTGPTGTNVMDLVIGLKLKADS